MQVTTYKVVTAFIALGIAAAIANREPTPAPAPPSAEQLAAERTEKLPMLARHSCSLFVERAAHDPDSIEWLQRPMWRVESRGREWSVQVELHANNRFGGKVRQAIPCVVRDEGDSFTLVRLGR